MTTSQLENPTKNTMEPILNPENFRFTIYPIKYPSIWGNCEFGGFDISSVK